MVGPNYRGIKPLLQPERAEVERMLSREAANGAKVRASDLFRVFCVFRGGTSDFGRRRVGNTRKVYHEKHGKKVTA